MCRHAISMEFTPSLVIKECVAMYCSRLHEEKRRSVMKRVEIDSAFLKKHTSCIRYGAHCGYCYFIKEASTRGSLVQLS